MSTEKKSSPLIIKEVETSRVVVYYQPGAGWRYQLVTASGHGALPSEPYPNQLQAAVAAGLRYDGVGIDLRDRMAPTIECSRCKGTGNCGWTELCEHCRTAMVPGAIWPMNEPTDHAYVERCDKCKIFASDVDAAKSVSEKLQATFSAGLLRWGSVAYTTTGEPYIEGIAHDLVENYTRAAIKHDREKNPDEWARRAKLAAPTEPPPPDPGIEATVRAWAAVPGRPVTPESYGQAFAAKIFAGRAGKGAARAEIHLSEIELAAMVQIAYEEAVACDAIAEIREILWPSGNPNSEWSSDTSDEIAQALRRHGFAPKEED